MTKNQTIKKPAKPKGVSVDYMAARLVGSSADWARFALPNFIGDRALLAQALIEKSQGQSEAEQLNTAVILLFCGNRSGEALFLDALKDRSSALHEQAANYLDIITPMDSKRQGYSPNVPLTAATLFGILEPLLQLPYEAAGKQALLFCLRHGQPGAQELFDAAMQTLARSPAQADGYFVVIHGLEDMARFGPLVRKMLDHPAHAVYVTAARRLLSLGVDDGALNAALRALLAKAPDELCGSNRDWGNWHHQTSCLCERIRELSGQDDPVLAEAAAVMSRRAIDGLLALPDPAEHLASAIGQHGFNDLFIAAMRHQTTVSLEWLQLLAHHPLPAITPYLRAFTLLQYMRMSGQSSGDAPAYLQAALDATDERANWLLAAFAELAGPAVLPILLAALESRFREQAIAALRKLPQGAYSESIVEALNAINTPDLYLQDRRVMTWALAWHSKKIKRGKRDSTSA
jgi:hypothetical protein